MFSNGSLLFSRNAMCFFAVLVLSSAFGAVCAGGSRRVLMIAGAELLSPYLLDGEDRQDNSYRRQRSRRSGMSIILLLPLPAHFTLPIR